MLFAPSREATTPQLIQKSWSARTGRSRPRGILARARVLRPWLAELEARVMLSNWSGPLTSNTTFVSTQVQNIVGDVDVEPGVTLTIQPGTIVQFNGGKSLTVDGTVLAQGTASKTIFFTSVQDNSASGGSNTASPGDWGSITFDSDSTGSVVSDAAISYGGSFGGPSVEDLGGPLSLSNSSVSDSGGAGVRLQQSSATLDALMFENNSGPAVSMDLDSNPTITGETAASFTGNSTNGLRVDGGSLVTNLSWDNPDIVYALNSSVDVPSGKTLSIGAGQIIKSGGASLSVEGTLDAQGTPAAPVIFTSLEDDASGGNTDNDTSNNVGHRGDWSDLQFNSDSLSNVMNDVEVLYAGSFGSPAVVDNGGPLTMTGGAVSDSYAAGIRLVQSTATLGAVSFNDDGGAAVSMDLDSTPTITGETPAMITGNGDNGVLVDNGTLAENLTWNNADIVYVLSNTVTVPGGRTLTIGAGQIIKSGGGGISVDGTLAAQGTAAAPVIFTSFYDCSFGGNSGPDTSRMPQPGDWSGLELNSASTANVLTQVEVLYGGSFGTPAIFANGGPLSLAGGGVSHTYATGVRLVDSMATLSAITFNGNGGPAIETDVNSNLVVTGELPTSFSGNGNNGVQVDGATLTQSVTWNSPDVVYTLGGSVNVPKGITLTIGAGQIIKSGGASLTVDGTLDAQGTALAPVVFTSLRDDSQGGDTNSDGSTTLPSPGDWGGLQLNADSANNVLDDVDVFYAGSFGSPAIYDDGGPLAINAGTFEDNESGAIETTAGSDLVVTGETPASFTGNGNNGVVVNGGTLSQSATWNNTDVVYTLGGNVNVAAGVTLTIGAGQIIKSGNRSLVVDGTLDAQGNAGAPIVFTSLNDDSQGGDTTSGGGSPHPGDWDGVQFNPDSSNNVMNNVELFYATTAVDDSGAALAINSVTFEDNANRALEATPQSNLVITGETAASFTGNGSNGVTLDSGSLAQSETWNNPGVVYIINGDVTVPQGMTLTIDPGQVIKFTGRAQLTVAGTLARRGRPLRMSSLLPSRTTLPVATPTTTARTAAPLPATGTSSSSPPPARRA